VPALDFPNAIRIKTSVNLFAVRPAHERRLGLAARPVIERRIIETERVTNLMRQYGNEIESPEVGALRLWLLKPIDKQLVRPGCAINGRQVTV
jgi:hypothetical protein